MIELEKLLVHSLGVEPIVEPWSNQIKLGSERSPVDGSTGPIGQFSLIFKTLENRKEKWKEIKIKGK